KQTAQQMNYRPNFFASGLSGKQPKILMLCLSHLQDHWASTIAAAFENEASLHGYRVLISAFHDKENPLEFSREILGPQGVSAMAILGHNTNKLTDIAIDNLLNDGVHIVTVGREIDDKRVGQILIDNEDGVRQAANHFYNQNLNNI